MYAMYIMFLICISVIVYWSYKKMGGREKAMEEMVENGKEIYKEAFSVLSYELVNRLVKVLGQIVANRSIGNNQIPLEVYMAIYALKDIKSKGQYGYGNSKAESAVQNFEAWMSNLPNVAIDFVQNAQSKGLGFGVITNSVADMALYSAMDKNERNKNVMTANMEIRSFIKEHLENLKNELLNC